MSYLKKKEQTYPYQGVPANYPSAWPDRLRISREWGVLLLESGERGHGTTPRCRNAAAIGTHRAKATPQSTSTRPLLRSSSFISGVEGRVCSY